MKYFKIEVGTDWVGMNTTCLVVTNKEEEEIFQLADELSINNFDNHGAFDYLLEELFPDVDEYTDEMLNEASGVEAEYMFFYTEEISKEEFDELEKKGFEIIEEYD